MFGCVGILIPFYMLLSLLFLFFGWYCVVYYICFFYFIFEKFHKNNIIRVFLYIGAFVVVAVIGEISNFFIYVKIC